ncbi:hypothetical protein L6164_000097 [Bauhinia variegata]|uniref:Uncharacterized protein n=1 Tax=Bauhinia variegata TaxID=167791 RepID=A0ACB9Q7H2_BAUVA|nr:hypothetical protein L6164_000097 [Bauhinia variegata]
MVRMLRAMYLSKPTVNGEIIAVYQPSHVGKQKSVSTFGYVDQGLGGLKLWVLDKALDAKIPNPACALDFSMEPCYHYPPRHDCKGNSIEDLAFLFPYTRKCADYSSGVKLVNDHQ